MVPIERFSHEFNSILLGFGYPYLCMYDQNMKGNIRFMIKKSNDLSSGLESIYDPIIDNLKYSVSTDNVDSLIHHFNSRLKFGKPYIYYGYLSKLENPNSSLEINYDVINIMSGGNSVEFDICGGLYNIFSTLLLINESLFLSTSDPKFLRGDCVMTNFGKAFVYDYLYDIKSDGIEYVCGMGDFVEEYSESIEYRSIIGDDIRFDRNYKIDKILK